DGRFEGIPLSYRTLGALIGRREQGESFARNAEDTVKTITQRVSSIPPDRRPRVYYARGPRGLETGLGGWISVETIELVAQNVAGGTRGGLANVSIEQVLLWNPDVIITIDQDFAANVSSDPAWAPVAAVRAHRVHLSPKLPFGWVDFPPTVNRLIGLWWLAKILYPDVFPEDLRALTHEFYARFYHVTPSDAQSGVGLGAWGLNPPVFPALSSSDGAPPNPHAPPLPPRPPHRAGRARARAPRRVHRGTLSCHARRAHRGPRFAAHGPGNDGRARGRTRRAIGSRPARGRGGGGGGRPGRPPHPGPRSR